MQQMCCIESQHKRTKNGSGEGCRFFADEQYDNIGELPRVLKSVGEIMSGESDNLRANDSSLGS
jgi:hypothetical protein